MSSPSSLKSLILPLTFFVLTLIPFSWDQKFLHSQVSIFSQTLASFYHITSVLLWMSGGWLFSRLIDVFIWNFIFVRRLKASPPGLLIEIGHALIALMVLTGILGGVFEVPVSGIWATSGAVGLVLGLALQNTINDAFSGLAMNFDHALSIGDWVQVHQKGLPTHTGKIVEVNWRTTQILTKDNMTVIFPNSLLARLSIVNLSRPYPTSRFKIDLTFPLYLSQERVCRALEVALYTTEGITNIPKKPKVKLRSISELGMTYQLRYWIDPTHLSPSSVRSALMSAIQDSLKHSGISPSIPTYYNDLPKRELAFDWSNERLALLQKIDLFNPLSPADLSQLSHQMKWVEASTREILVEEGTEGQSMFIIAEGCIEVSILQNGEQKQVNLLSSGDFFGENSLLTGSPRNATLTALTSTVCFEITPSMIRPFLEEHPDLIEQLSKTLSQRIREISRYRQQSQDSLGNESLSQGMSLKIKRFFGFLNSM